MTSSSALERPDRPWRPVQGRGPDRVRADGHRDRAGDGHAAAPAHRRDRAPGGASDIRGV